MGKTTIEWCDFTFNPWIGCTKVSAGCANCYAETLMDKRWKKVKWGPGAARKRASPAYWWQPIKWDNEAANDGVRRRVFCASLSDVFDEAVPDDWRRDLFRTIAQTPNLDWLLLTKRSKKMREFMQLAPDLLHILRNVWLGVSIEDQKTADERIPDLLESAAAVRFVSYEPALGPVDFTKWIRNSKVDAQAAATLKWAGQPDHSVDVATKGIDWIIVGGESGSHARPFDITWAHSTIRTCWAAGVSCFVKQMGANVPGFSEFAKDRKGGDPWEWPKDLRVRQFPNPKPLGV